MITKNRMGSLKDLLLCCCRFFVFYLVFNLVFSSTPALSQENSKHPLDMDMVKEEILSPWTTKARNWLIGGSALTATLLVFRKQTIDPMQEDFSTHKPLGKLSPIGDYGGQFIPNALYSFGMFAAFKWTGENRYRDWSLIMLKASTYAVTTSTVLKVTVREPRPNDPGDRKSFPSGHTTAAFAFSSVVVAENGFFPYGISALTLSTLTGLSRINDNKHYLHDVVAGATIGTVFGLGVSEIHRLKSSRNKAIDNSQTKISSLTVIPAIAEDFMGLLISYQVD